MCIVYLFLDNAPESGAYQVILAVNRDESFKRPTAPANFWNDHCVSGLDLEPGREGGTWFGTSKTSKTGALLNILGASASADKKGRGPLVTNYLTGTEDAKSYITQIAAVRHSYNAFNLVLLEKKDGEWLAFYCSTENDAPPRRMPAGVSVYGNSDYSRPLQKVVCSRKKFEEIVTKFNSVSKDAKLKESLMEMLKDRRPYMPDPQLEAQFPPGYTFEIQSLRSAVFVSPLKQFAYGTRTHTILLIDDVGHCEYVESTISDFSDVMNPVWQTVTHAYNLNLSK